MSAPGAPRIRNGSTISGTTARNTFWRSRQRAPAKAWASSFRRLLAWSESAVIYDIKGENWAKTAGFRAQQGHLCFKFSPVEAEQQFTIQSSFRGPPLHAA